MQDVCDAGGEVRLRAMGPMPWNEDDVVDIANNVLFPDLVKLWPKPAVNFVQWSLTLNISNAIYSKEEYSTLVDHDASNLFLPCDVDFRGTIGFAPAVQEFDRICNNPSEQDLQ